MKNKRILFMGTPDFAEKSLVKLLDEGFSVVGVVTQPDKPKGRGHKMMFPPVKERAIENNIPVFQPETLKNGELKDILDELSPEIIVVVAYGKILPQYVLSYPKYGCINVHGSILPKYRGAAPIQWAVINGESETGVTTMLMDKGLDTGDMLLIEKTKIGKYETAEELFERLSILGGEVLVKTILNLTEIKPIPQNNDESTYAPIIKKEMAEIDWSKSSEEISNLVRGMNSWPMAYTYYKGEIVKIISATIADGTGKAGEIDKIYKNNGLKVFCGEGAIFVKDVQFAGKKRMNIEDYMRGHTISQGEYFGKE